MLGHCMPAPAEQTLFLTAPAPGVELRRELVPSSQQYYALKFLSAAALTGLAQSDGNSI